MVLRRHAGMRGTRPGYWSYASSLSWWDETSMAGFIDDILGALDEHELLFGGQLLEEHMRCRI